MQTGHQKRDDALQKLLPGITVFCPIYNEEQILTANTKRLLEHLEGLGLDFEVIIGSNGSTDKSDALLQDIAGRYPAVRWFALKQKGVGAAFAQGVQKARFDKIVTVDMDLSIDLGFIGQAAKLLEKDADMVIGAKVTGNQKRPWSRKAASALFISLARFLLGINFHDYSIAAKGYRTSLAQSLLWAVDDKTFYVVRIAHLANSHGKKILEIPVDCLDMRESRFNLLHEGFYKFGNLFLLWGKTLLQGKKPEKKA